jgi:hypothetical protein
LLYSAVLNKIQAFDEELSEEIHSSNVSRVSVSPLRGDFKQVDENRKKVFPDGEYRASICLLGREGAADALANQLLLKDGVFELGDAVFDLSGFEVEETCFEEFAEVEQVESLFFHFESPVCIKYPGSDVVEMYPHREAVFKALEYRWNQLAPEDLQFEVDLGDLKQCVVEKPVFHKTHNVVVTRKGGSSGCRPVKEFGFTGKTEYGFSGGSASLRHKLAVLTRFAGFAGLGGHVGRGLGDVRTEIEKSDK